MASYPFRIRQGLLKVRTSLVKDLLSVALLLSSASFALREHPTLHLSQPQRHGSAMYQGTPGERQNEI